MRRTALGLSTMILVMSGCGERQPSGQTDRSTNVARAVVQPAPTVSNEVASTRPPPLEEPKGPIDPKSVEAAGQVVQQYGALIEQGRWKEAEALWGSAELAGQFDRALRRDREIHLEIGDLGEPEGAAGSIYVSMPVSFYGKDAAGASFRKPAEIVIRRVNDVDGSTEAQRRWHIERIEWKSGA